MSFLVVPKQGKGQAAAAPQGWPWSTGDGGDSSLDKAISDVVVAQARAAERAAGQIGALQAYNGFEQNLAAEQALSRRLVHNERFLGNTLKQVDSHNQRQGGSSGVAASAPARLLGGHLGGTRRTRSERGAGASRSRTRRKVTAVFEKQGTLGIYFEESAATGAPTVTAVRAGGLAVHNPDIVPGLVLTQVQGIKIKCFDYKTTLDLMKGAERPLTLKFLSVDAAAEAADGGRTRRKERKRHRSDRDKRTSKHAKRKKHKRKRHQAKRSRPSHGSSSSSGSSDVGSSGGT